MNLSIVPSLVNFFNVAIDEDQDRSKCSGLALSKIKALHKTRNLSSTIFISLN